MTASVRGYLFLLGLATGLGVLAITSYRRVSPNWLKGLLFACGLFVIARYVTMAIVTSAESAQPYWGLFRCWFGSSVGLTIPSAVAVDQLLRHPAMTPKKLLGWLSPWLIAYAAIVLLGTGSPVQDPVAGLTPQLTPMWRLLLVLAQLTFVAGFLALAGFFFTKVPTVAIRIPLALLIAAHLCLAVNGVILWYGRGDVRPSLYSEMAALVVLWYAFDTAARLQTST